MLTRVDNEFVIAMLGASIGILYGLLRALLRIEKLLAELTEKE